MIERARLGQIGGPAQGRRPFVFGRGGEELLACTGADVPTRVVPGVSSAIAVPAAAGIPVTHRGISHAFSVISGHVPPSPAELSALVRLRRHHRDLDGRGQPEPDRRGPVGPRGCPTTAGGGGRERLLRLPAHHGHHRRAARVRRAPARRRVPCRRGDRGGGPTRRPARRIRCLWSTCAPRPVRPLVITGWSIGRVRRRAEGRAAGRLPDRRDIRSSVRRPDLGPRATRRAGAARARAQDRTERPGRRPGRGDPGGHRGPARRGDGHHRLRHAALVRGGRRRRSRGPSSPPSWTMPRSWPAVRRRWARYGQPVWRRPGRATARPPPRWWTTGRDGPGRRRVAIQLHGYTDEVQLSRLREVSEPVLTVTPYRWVRPTAHDRLPQADRGGLLPAAGRADVHQRPWCRGHPGGRRGVRPTPDLVDALQRDVVAAAVGPVTAGPLLDAGSPP